MRDDFSEGTKRIIARRVNGHCSNPTCWAITSGPHADPSKTINIGVAAHITAASPGGPRFSQLTPKQRQDPKNGIWLCQNCATLIDRDELIYPVEILFRWKQDAEERAFRELGQPNKASSKEVSNDIVPMDILYKIEPYTSLELVREILSSPHKIYKSIVSAFSEIEIKTNVWNYSFKNADIEIESDDGESVKVVTLQSHDMKPHNIFKIPFSESIGILTIHDVLQECGSKKLQHFTSMRDAYIAMEYYKGRLGGYLVFTFGCYGYPDLIASTYVDGTLRNHAGEEVDISEIPVNFVSITHEENRGHPIGQGF